MRLVLILLPVICLGADEFGRARQINLKSVGTDSHIDTVQWAIFESADLGKRHDAYQVDIPRLFEGGMRNPYFALYVPTYYKGPEAIRRILQLRDATQNLLDSYPSKIELALNAADVVRIQKGGKIAAVLTIESGHTIADDLSVLRMYYQLGVRSMTLVHFRNSNWADSSTDTPEHNGLTEFGKSVVREMNRIGMIVDVSHVSDRAFYDAISVSTKPVIASHSSCRALSDFPRNMTDDMIRAVAKNGGVVGINFGGGFLNPKDAEKYRQRIGQQAVLQPNLSGKDLDEFAHKEYIAGYSRMGPTESTLEDVVKHIDHVVKIAGIDHVGIGSDYDGIGTVPKGLEDVSKMPALTAALLEKGYREADVLKILGGNHLRVLRAVTGR